MAKNPAPDRRKIQLGRRGEEMAADFLVERGFELIGRNVRTPYGELDLVGQKNGILVLFEVKTRTGLGYGYPEEAVNRKKQTHLYQSALHYVSQLAQPNIDWRIDVIAILQQPGMKNPEIQWFENVVAEPE